MTMTNKQPIDAVRPYKPDETITIPRRHLEQLMDALRPFDEAQQFARQQFDTSPQIAILKQVAFYYLEWPHLTRASDLLHRTLEMMATP